MAKSNDLAARAEPFLQRIESLDADRQTEHAGYMARCRTIASDIKQVFQQAKAEGIAVRALRGVVKRRKLERKIAAIPAALDDVDDAAQYDALAEAFGVDTPMGQHAAKEADARRRKAGGEDVRPRSLRQRERDRNKSAAGAEEKAGSEPRADEANLERVGRGEVVDTLVN